MTALARIRRARRVLGVVVVVVGLLWAAAVGAAVVALAALAARFVTLPAAARLAVLPTAVVGALAGAAVVVWRGRAARSLARVALWVEEHDPALHFALVTAIDHRVAPAAAHGALHAVAARAPIEAIVRRAVVRAVGLASVAAMLAGAAAASLHPRELLGGAGGAVQRHSGLAGRAPLANRLAPLSARIEPPAYARMQASTIREPTSLVGLVGSRLTLLGRGPADGVVATIGRDTLRARETGEAWAIATTMPAAPAVAVLRDRDYHRLVTLEPRPDSAPSVKLAWPASDTTYQQVPRGDLVVEARAGDDVGLAFGYVEYLLSTGAEESFQTRLSTSRRVGFGNARTGVLRDVVRFDTLKLVPGSVLHIRVVAYDHNDVTGPGKGVSETRTLRVAEPVDSTSVNAAPPLPIDTLWVSQRLLNLRTDTLIRNRRRLARADFTGTSSAYGNAQELIRRRVLKVITLVEGDGVGGSFQTETSTKLREVAALMWTARTDLGIAMPDTAMPVMRRILKMLDELRLAHRYYLRGLLKPVAVNVERVRLAGKDSAAAAARTPRAALGDSAATLVARLDRLATARGLPAAAAAESLTFVRIRALTVAPAAAAPLQRAIADLGRGVSVPAAIAPVRRLLAPPPRIVVEPSEWKVIAP